MIMTIVKRSLLMASFCLLAATQGNAVELKIWAPANFTPASGLLETAETYRDLYKRFEEQNPDIQIKVENLRGSTEALQQILTAASAGNLPDLGVLDGFWVVRLVEAGVLQPLNTLWLPDDRSDFYPDVIDPVTVDGNIYAVWFHNAWRGFFYNVDVLEDLGYDNPPATWDAFLKFGKTVKERGQHAVMLPCSRAEYTTLHMLPMYWGLGGRLVDDAGAPVFFEGENRAALEKVYQLYRDLVVDGLMPVAVNTMHEKAILPFFYTNEAVMVAESSSRIQQIMTDRPEMKGKLGAANYPLPAGKTAVPVLVGWTWGMFAKDPAHQEAAWRFVQFMTSTENLGRLNEVQGHLPVRKSIWNRDYFAQNPLMRQFKEIFDASGMRPRPPVAIYPAISDALRTQMGDVLSGKLTPAQAVDNAREMAMEEYHRMTKR